MTIWNLGSINIDNVYRVPHLPKAGETLAADSFQRGLGGKGANMSVAAARAAARVRHIGAIGTDGKWAAERLLEYGVDTRSIKVIDTPTGHANIAVADDGENQIIIHHGANFEVSSEQTASALSEAEAGDFLLLQNETNAQIEAAQIAQTIGLTVVYAAAPFETAAVKDLIPHTDMLVLNEVEADQLTTALGTSLNELPVEHVIVTKGSEGADWLDLTKGDKTHVAAIKVDPIDTTGAGDTFTGYLCAGLDRGQPMLQALELATKAAALMVTRLGTADVIPDLKELQDARLA